MKCEEIIRLIEEEYPKSCAESWDNPGLMAGSKDHEVRKIMISLDATDEVIEQAVINKADMLITHHPMIFGGIKQINDSFLTGRRILKLIRNNIACYAMHTNFDIRGMADLNEKQLGLVNTQVLFETGEYEGKAEGIGRVGYLKEEMSYEELAKYVKKSLGIPNVRCYGNTDKMISKVAISGGSGKSIVPSALKSGAQVLVTGDIDYHTGIDAAAEGLFIIDAGHFGTEKVFIEYMTEKLKKKLEGKCVVMSADQSAPFTVR
jgi:dinuclear metal center YbgI/SA1388 family protein